VQAHHQRYDQYGAPYQQFGISDPIAYDLNPLQAGVQVQGDYPAAAVDNRNAAARAGDAAGDYQKKQAQQATGARDRKVDYDPNVIERIVTKERESRAKLPKYPGLERYTLVEKMGDGAFSNVYRAKDITGQYDEVAIKVVRKFEMNNNQVCSTQTLYSPLHTSLFSPVRFTLLSNYRYTTALRAFTNIASCVGR